MKDKLKMDIQNSLLIIEFSILLAVMNSNRDNKKLHNKRLDRKKLINS